MYKNRIRHATPKLSPNSHPKFFIRRSEIPFDERRVRYIESVCQVLIESRFGACLAEPVTIDLSDRPELEPVSFSDLLDDEHEFVPFYALLPQGRSEQTSCLRSDKFSGTHGPVDTNASVNERALQFWDARTGLSGTAFLGRGSP